MQARLLYAFSTCRWRVIWKHTRYCIAKPLNRTSCSGRPEARVAAWRAAKNEASIAAESGSAESSVDDSGDRRPRLAAGVAKLSMLGSVGGLLSCCPLMLISTDLLAFLFTAYYR